jgi:hypothetical protein
MTAAGFLSGLAALLLVLTAPLSAAFAVEAGGSDAHACCQSVEETSAGHADGHDCAPMAAPTSTSHPCGCHLTPDDGEPGAAVSLTASTVTFGAPVAAQTNIQVDIPLAREPDEPAPAAALQPKPSSALYLLNSVLLL